MLYTLVEKAVKTYLFYDLSGRAVCPMAGANCANITLNNISLPFCFRFPGVTKSPKQHREWLVKLRRKGFTPTKYTRLCSVHFEDSCFIVTNDTRRLQASAVPTKFDFPPRLQKTDKKRKPPLQRTVPVTVASSSMSVTDCGPSSSMSAPDCGPSSDEHPSVTVTHDHPYDVKKSLSKLKRELDDALQVVSKFKKKLKVSQRKTSRPKKKVDSLISVVESPLSV